MLLTVVSVLARAADELPEGFKIQVSGWSYDRARKTVTGSNRVNAYFTIKNVSDAKVDELNLTLNYATGLGEKAARPLTQKAGTLKAGESKKITITSEFIPIFSAYTIVVEYSGGKKEEWYANSDIGQPLPKITEPLKGVASVAVLGKEAGSDRAGRFSGTVRVKNEGTVEAKNLKVIVTFFDAKKGKISEWSGTLGRGKLAGGAEENIPFTAGSAPKAYNSYEIRVSCDDTPPDQALAGGDFSNAEDVEFGKFAFNRSKVSMLEVKVTAQVRNGFGVPVEHVKLAMKFLGMKKREIRSFTYEVPGQLKPGEIKPVEFTITELPTYESYEQKIDYVKVAGAPAAAPALTDTRVKPGKFQKIADVEVIFTESLTNDDKSVSLLGAVRNGKETPVKDIIVTVTFTMPKGDPISIDKVLTDITQAGEERNFVVRAASVAGFASYDYKFKCSGVTADGTVVKPAEPRVESAPPPKEPEQKEPEKQPEPKPAPKPEVKGALDGAL
jgi:hypothetical protein